MLIHCLIPDRTAHSGMMHLHQMYQRRALIVFAWNSTNLTSGEGDLVSRDHIYWHTLFVHSWWYCHWQVAFLDHTCLPCSLCWQTCSPLLRIRGTEVYWHPPGDPKVPPWWQSCHFLANFQTFWKSSRYVQFFFLRSTLVRSRQADRA